MPEYLQSGAIIGIQPGELWQMTPAELGYMVEGWKKQQEIHDRRTAQICCALYEINRNKKKKPTPYKITDFMPGGSGKQPEQTAEQQAAFLKSKFRKN